jgi:peroxiredoxin
MLVAFVSACAQKEKPKEVYAEAQPSINNQMPGFNITKTDGTKLAFKQLTGKVMVVFFNPGCDHCQREAKLISEHKDVIKDYQVYFVSPEPMDSIAKFSYDYKLVEKNVHFGQGNAPEIINAVGPITTVPTIFIYDKQQQVARMEGEISIEKLREMLK